MHFFSKKFAHIKKKYYLCTRFQKGDHETPKRNPKKETKMKTIIEEAKTEKRDIQLATYNEGKFPYTVYYWSRKTAHMYGSSFATLQEARAKFEEIKNKK